MGITRTLEHSEYIIIHIFTSNEMSLFYGYFEYVNCVCVCINVNCEQQANTKTKPIVAMLAFNKNDYFANIYSHGICIIIHISITDRTENTETFPRVHYYKCLFCNGSMYHDILCEIHVRKQN